MDAVLVASILLERICNKPGCTDPVKAKGVCNKHYYQAWRQMRGGNSYAEARVAPHYGDDDFPGYGKVVCQKCDRPYRDHAFSERCY